MKSNKRREVLVQRKPYKTEVRCGYTLTRDTYMQRKREEKYPEGNILTH